MMSDIPDVNDIRNKKDREIKATRDMNVDALKRQLGSEILDKLDKFVPQDRAILVRDDKRVVITHNVMDLYDLSLYEDDGVSKKDDVNVVNLRDVLKDFFEVL